MTTNVEPSPAAQRTLRWQLAVPIAITIYFVIVEIWSRLFFAGYAPGPYRLLSLHTHFSHYMMLLLLFIIIVLVLETLKIRRREQRITWQPLLGAVLMIVLSAMLCGWSITGEIDEDSAATISNSTYYLVENSHQNSGFSDLMLVECDRSGLACLASFYTQIKVQDTARLDISPSGGLVVIECIRLSGICGEVAPMPLS
jgi:hypothetical protein